MILAVDIGNTNIAFGTFESGTLRFTLRLPSDPRRSVGAYAEDIRRLLATEAYEPEAVEGCILSSVVPALQPTIVLAIQGLTGRQVLLADQGMDTGLVIKNYDPAQLGSDRIVDAVCARAHYMPPIAIFDMGTATTLSVLDPDGCFVGGMIMPGLRLSVDALTAQAAQLPTLEFETPKQLLGTDTVSCMQSGAIYGAAALLDGITERVEIELGQAVTVVVTGGLSGFVVPHCHHPVIHDKQLLLKGLYLLYQLQ